MDIGSNIKKYRKKLSLTQEQLASRLGVTAPAVNKWEKGNSYPDIELLSPIARILGISLDTLLSFHEQLSTSEINDIIEKMNIIMENDGYDKAYEYSDMKIKEYPNCNMLILQVATMLDANRLEGICSNPNKYDAKINDLYERALNDKSEEIRYCAASSLFGYYIRKKEYAKAKEYLEYFSEHDPKKKINQARLYKEQGESNKAFEILENLLLSGNRQINMILTMMMAMYIENNEYDMADKLAEKAGDLAKVFDMGLYNENSSILEIVATKKDIDGTYELAKILLQSVDTLFDFQKSMLYKHVEFKDIDKSYVNKFTKGLAKMFKDDNSFDYMKEYKGWNELLEKY